MRCSNAFILIIHVHYTKLSSHCSSHLLNSLLNLCAKDLFDLYNRKKENIKNGKPMTNGEVRRNFQFWSPGRTRTFKCAQQNAPCQYSTDLHVVCFFQLSDWTRETKPSTSKARDSTVIQFASFHKITDSRMEVIFENMSSWRWSWPRIAPWLR